MNPHNLEETAMSEAGGARPGPERTEADIPVPVDATQADATDAGGPADVTVVRGAPSTATVNDVSGPGQFGKYELLGEVARGGMGVVYRARQHGLDRLVALKMILGTGNDQETAQRFLQEARSAAALDHPNVVPIYDTGEINGRPYFTMALIEGPNLRAFIEQQGQPPIPVAVSLFAQIVAGVAHAHRHGFIHRDLKPANVLIDNDGRPRVTDFGLAKRAAVDSQLTATGQVVGTPQYMAPEQARDSKDVGPPADVYALGAILYFLLTGRPPLTADNLTDLLIKVVSEEPDSPRLSRADVPEDLEELCLRCLAKKPADRFPDADALAAALAPIADRYLTPSNNFSPSVRQIALGRGSRPSAPGLPDASRSSASGVGAHSRTAMLPAAEEPAPTPNRKPVLIGLGALAVVLVAVIAYLATRDNKGQETAQPNPPEKLGPGLPGLPPGPPPGLPLPPPPGPKELAKFAWPPPARKDFGLKVVLDAPGKKTADGKILLADKTEMTLQITADKDCRVAVFFLDPSGEDVRLFPNKYESDDRLVAGQPRVIPGKNGGVLEASPTQGDVDRIRVIVTTGEGLILPPGRPKNQFTIYAGEDRERLTSTIRGIVLKPPGGKPGATEVADAELLIRVEK